MAAILRMGYNGYQYLFKEIVDPRTESWLLVAKPYQIVTILTLYLLFVLKWGPAWMKNKRPYNLDKLLIFYNIGQIIFCAYVFACAIWYAWGWDYRWICEPVDFTSNPKSLIIAKCVHHYFLCKVVDLLDTVFFVLRKKQNQISFLHVYHHTGMVMLTWGASTYFPGGHGTLIGVINSFVHIVMYGYYLLTVAYPVYKQSLWWKKYITQLQILQFFWCVVHMTIIVFKTDCAYPRWTSAVFLPQNLFMLILFIDFYIKTYIKKPKLEVKSNGVNKIEQNNNVELTKKQNLTKTSKKNVLNDTLNGSVKRTQTNEKVKDS